jgi:hypothetical protein
MAPGIKTGGRKKGTKNRRISTKRRIAQSVAQTLVQLDVKGKSMAAIQIESARYIWDLAEQERAKPEPQRDAVTKLMAMASKLAHDVSPYLYPTQQAIKHGGEEDAAPIRMESLSEHQLEVLIGRLRRG